MKGAKGAYNARYVKGIDQISIPKTRVGGNAELRAKVKANVEASAAARASSKFDEYLKIEKELLEALEKKKTSSRGPFEGTGKPPDRIYDEFGNPLPFGFSNVKQYNDLVKSLKEELPEGTQVLFQGSSVTGVSHKKGLPFDQGRKSDFDIALVNDDLFLEALEIGRGGGFKMKTDPNRIGPLDEKQLDRLGLLEIIEKKSKEAGRPVSFMLYESVEQALKRPSLMVTP